jgi:hypothetical protein
MWLCGHATHNKIDNESQKVETNLIGVWHNEDLPHDTNTIGIITLTLWISIINNCKVAGPLDSLNRSYKKNKTHENKLSLMLWEKKEKK